jgi:Zn-dependent protease with chaperone function
VTSAAALFYDGRTSSAQPSRVELQDNAGTLQLVVERDGSRVHVPFAECVSDAGVGDAHLRIELPSGESLEITDPAAWSAQLQRHGLQRTDRALAQVERRWLTVAMAAVMAVLAGWAMFRFGVPALVDRAVALMPATTDARIGAGGLAVLDQQAFGPTALPASRRDELRHAFAGIANELGMSGRVRLEFRDGRELGPNAFALPDGIVVLTDGLAKLSRHDDELRAVFAHEIGHVQHRHAMRALLSSSLNALLAVAILGDVTSATTLIAGVPVTLAHAANSRAFEREADAVARRWMQRAGVPPHRLGDLLQRLAAERDHGGWNYLSSHPPLAERLQGTSD